MALRMIDRAILIACLIGWAAMAYLEPWVMPEVLLWILTFWVVARFAGKGV